MSFDTLSKASSWLMLLLLAAASSSVHSIPVDATGAAQDASDKVKDTITVHQGILGAVCIVVGLLLLAFGYRLYKTIIFTAGFIIGSIVGYIVLTRVEPSNGYGDSRDLILLLGSFGFGLLCGGLLLCLRKVAIFAVGALGGFFLAMFILGLKSGGLIEPQWGRYVFIGVFMLIGCLLAIRVERQLIMGATAFAGGYGVIFGIDCYVKTGFAQAANHSIASGTFSPSEYTVDGKVIGMAIGVVVLALFGFGFQHRSNRDRHAWHGSHK
ncbi:hypothetical protein HDU97_003627 [Phlyctochytrium planicorne]|nr:hypothetical protein HDU97_003627 [Phlyctochytrium planicorne]